MSTTNEFLEKYRRGEFDPTQTPLKPLDFKELYLEAPEPVNESQRRKALWYYKTNKTFKNDILPIMEIAKHFFNVQSILVSFLDNQFMLSYYSYQFSDEDVPKSQSFCSHAILAPQAEVFLVTDASKDWRFQGNSLVTKENGIRFYMGSPIRVNGVTQQDKKDIYASGMVCLIDTVPRYDMTDRDKKMLAHLADLVKSQLDLWLSKRQLLTRNDMIQSIVTFTENMERKNSVITDGEALIKEVLSAPFVKILATNDSYISFNWKDHSNAKHSSLDSPVKHVSIPVKNHIWTSDDLTEMALVVKIPNSDNNYIVVYTNDPTQVFDEMDEGYVMNFAQCMTVVIQQQMVIKANEAKTRFIESVSHELRTPLHGILSSAELLLEEESTTPTQKGMLLVVQSSGKNLINVINGLLDFHRWESSEVKTSSEIFNVIDMLQDVMDAFVVTVKEDVSLLVETSIAKESEYLVSDGGCLRQILLNVVDNAVKFTNHGHVKCRSSVNTIADGHILQVAVEDTGRGMSKLFMDNYLFNPFTKEDEYSQGVGLGMSITNTLVHALGGKLSVTSEKESGTTIDIQIPVKHHVSNSGEKYYDNTLGWFFIVPEQTRFLNSIMALLQTHLDISEKGTLPLHCLDFSLDTEKQIPPNGYTLIFAMPDEIALMPDSIANNEKCIVCTKPVGPGKLAKTLDALEGKYRKITEVERKQQIIERSKIKALIVDDNAVNRNMLAMFCKKRNMDYKMANDGYESFQVFQTATFDIVLMDIQMPKLNGPDAVKLIREYEKEKNLKPTLIIMLTGLSTDDMKEICYQVGADGFYVKPISLKTIDFVIQSHFTCNGDRRKV